MEKLACGIYEYITHLKFVKISLILTSLINRKFFEAPNSQGFKSYSSIYCQNSPKSRTTRGVCEYTLLHL